MRGPRRDVGHRPATALACAASGADVIVHGRDSGAAAMVVGEVRSLGRRAEAILADLGSRTEGDRLVEQAWNLWEGLDAWLHIAGADTLTGAIGRTPVRRQARPALGGRRRRHNPALPRRSAVGCTRKAGARSSPWDGIRPRPEWRVTRASCSPRPKAPSWRSPEAWPEPGPGGPGQRHGSRLDQDRLG